MCVRVAQPEVGDLCVSVTMYKKVRSGRIRQIGSRRAPIDEATLQPVRRMKGEVGALAARVAVSAVAEVVAELR